MLASEEDLEARQAFEVLQVVVLEAEEVQENLIAVAEEVQAEKIWKQVFVLMVVLEAEVEVQ